MNREKLENLALGIDIGGTGIKGALVNTFSGELVSERIKRPTPEGGKPQEIIATVQEILASLTAISLSVAQVSELPIGICFPAVVKNGHTFSAANISKEWIGLAAEKMFEQQLGQPIFFINDADAAGYAETHFGAGRGKSGLTIMTTLGTGIGTALMFNGALIPNAELGHLTIHGKDYEKKASYAAKERDDLSWHEWAERLQIYYRELEKLLSPDLFIVGGGVSKYAENFLPLIECDTPMLAALLRNNAGIIGAATLAVQPDR